MSITLDIVPDSTTDSYFPPNTSTCHGDLGDFSDGTYLTKQAYQFETHNSYGVGVSDIPATGIASITSVQALSRWQSEGHTSSVSCGIRIAGVNYSDISTTVVPDAVFNDFNGTARVTNPATGLAWTTSDVNGLGWWTTAGPYARDGDVLRCATLHFRTIFTLNSPSVTTNSASGVNLNSATLNGTLNPNGASATYPVSYYFEWGLTTGYGNTTTTVPGQTGSSNIFPSVGISGLTGTTLYHFRLVATTVEGTFLGSDLTFTSGAGDAISINF